MRRRPPRDPSQWPAGGVEGSHELRAREVDFRDQRVERPRFSQVGPQQVDCGNDVSSDHAAPGGYDGRVGVAGHRDWPRCGVPRERQQLITDLDERLNTAKIGPTEWRIVAKAKAVEVLAEAVTPTMPESIRLPSNRTPAKRVRRLSLYLETAESSPHVAVVHAWDLVRQIGAFVAEKDGSMQPGQSFENWVGYRFTGMGLPPDSLGSVLYQPSRLYADVWEYLTYYNQYRLHSTNGYQTPVETRHGYRHTNAPAA